VVFDRSYILADEAYAQAYAGMHKAGIYGYGHTMIHDGWLYVIFSIQKEQVAVLRMTCEDVQVGGPCIRARPLAGLNRCPNHQGSS